VVDKGKLWYDGVMVMSGSINTLRGAVIRVMIVVVVVAVSLLLSLSSFCW